jgi:hypothetical protein
MSFLGLFVSDESEDLLSINVVSALINDGIADFSYQYYQS